MSISIGSGTMMAQNFFSAGNEQSRYIKAKHIAAQSDISLMSSRQSAILSAGMAACASAKSMAELILEGKKAARQMDLDMQQSTSEASERNLKELRRRFEERSQKPQQSEEEQVKSTSDTPQIAASHIKKVSTSNAPDIVPPVALNASHDSISATSTVNVEAVDNVQAVGQNLSLVV